MGSPGIVGASCFFSWKAMDATIVVDFDHTEFARSVHAERELAATVTSACLAIWKSIMLPMFMR